MIITSSTFLHSLGQLLTYTDDQRTATMQQFRSLMTGIRGAEPYSLRFLLASRPEIMGYVLGIIYRVIVTHLIKEAGFSRKTTRTGAVTLVENQAISGCR